MRGRNVHRQRGAKAAMQANVIGRTKRGSSTRIALLRLGSWR